MSYWDKPFEDLDVLDNFLMNAIATNEEVGEAFCRKVLSVLLQRPVGKIKVVAQYTLPAQHPKYRGIRMDVKVEEFEDGSEPRLANVYDMEPHLQKNLHLPRHNRFYQAKMDSCYMKRGDDNFAGMPNLFVITILNFDPFGYDYMMYTFENRCAEVPELKYEDGLKFIYFYTGGTKGGSVNLKTMLQYLQHSTAGNAMDDSTKELHDYVCKVKTAPEVKEEYMRFEELIAFARKDAAEEAAEKAAKNTKVQAILELLEDYGEIPDSLPEMLQQSNDEALKKYHKLAARAESIEAFMTLL
ncbi:MAG: hypothetical protein HFH91_01390 [Lachnospiraceae bacterium]|nr:hypothetical protein [Lachnospiraceae bacterium]